MDNRLIAIKNLIKPYEGELACPLTLNVEYEPTFYSFTADEVVEWLMKIRIRTTLASDNLPTRRVVNLNAFITFLKNGKSAKDKKARAFLVAYLGFCGANYSTGQSWRACNNSELMTAAGVSHEHINQLFRELAELGAIKRTKVQRVGSKKVEDDIQGFFEMDISKQRKMRKRLMYVMEFFTEAEMEKPNFNDADAYKFSCYMHEVREHYHKVPTIIENHKAIQKAGLNSVPVIFNRTNKKDSKKYSKMPYYANPDGTYMSKGSHKSIHKRYQKTSRKNKEAAFTAIMERQNDFVQRQTGINGVGLFLRKGLFVVDSDDWRTKEDVWMIMREFDIKTSVVSSIREGAHMYFRGNPETIAEFKKYRDLYVKYTNSEYRNASKRVAKLDILDKGMVVMPGSMAPNGKTYQVKSAYKPALIKTQQVSKFFNRCGVYVPSKDYINLKSLQDAHYIFNLEQAGEHEKAAEARNSVLFGSGLLNERKYEKNTNKKDFNSILNRATQKFGIVTEGNRNVTMCKIWGWCGRQRYSDDIFKRIHAAICSPPLSEKELRNVMKLNRR